MANQWFRMYSEFATDPKVQMMTEAMQRRLTMLFCLTNSNALRNGVDKNSNVNSNEEVMFMLRINDAELNETKALFISKGFIDSDWNLLNWDKRQFVSDQDPTRAERQKRYREKHSNALRNAEVTLLEQNRTDTEQIQKERIAGKTPAGEICLALKAKQILDVNPSHPKLLALISAGASVEEFEGAANDVSVKKFAYILSTVEGRRADVKNLKLVQGKIEPKENLSWRGDDLQIFKKAKDLGIATQGKTRFELLAKIDEKRGAT